MPYNDTINRTDANALIPQEVAKEIIQNIAEESIVMRMARRLPNMTAKQRRLPVLTQLPHAYFVNGDTGFKQTTKVAWDNKFLEAEELAVIVPVAENVLSDSSYDMWGEIKPQLVGALGKKFDQAVLYGTEAPTSWPQNLLAGATAAANVITYGTGTPYEDLMGEDGVIAKVEEDGYFVNGHVAALQMRAKLRSIVDTTGQPVFRPMTGLQGATQYELDGSPIVFPRNGAVDPDQSLMISGDWSQLVYAIRQDITYKVSDQANITDNTGAQVYNLFQQDMVALRVVMRIAWQLPNPINRIQETEADRYPFAVLKPAP